MSTRLRILVVSLALLCTESCSDRRERNIIVDRAPFIEEHFTYDPGATDRIVISRAAVCRGQPNGLFACT